MIDGLDRLLLSFSRQAVDRAAMVLAAAAALYVALLLISLALALGRRAGAAGGDDA